ncbi:MAG: succinate dehydrogenase cytochrome b subunit [Muribaculaceae bacterium]|nr:succinate dehydrogenase cytochrome b subunit [Muribaculaceae bacterium]
MWLTCSTVGRKFIMAASGAVLVLFVTFHCCMNAIAICWPATYNSLCEFLGANWYALIASVFLALFILLHIVYACWLTLQNRKARGPVRYAVSKKPKTVEWSSKNMLVLGIVVLGFLVVHLIQFWAKMQLQEIRGVHDVLPPAAGTLFLQEAFQTNWTWIVYIIGFIALWFHLNHGIWSMFQSVGWDNTVWIARFKKLAVCWSTFICFVFIAEAIVFTAKAHEGYFKNDPTLREQYKDMLVPMFEKDFGPDAAQLGIPNVGALSYDDFGLLVDNFSAALEQLPESLDDTRVQIQLASIPTPEQKEQFLKALNRQMEGKKRLKNTKALLNYLNGVDDTDAPAIIEPVAFEEEAMIEEYATPAEPGEEDVDTTN